MSAIGGYFELELGKHDEYHPNAIKLNTGRNAFEYILIAKQYKKVYLPYFTCDVLLDPLKKLQIIYEFYSINELFEPIFDFSKIQINEVFLYTNYFGLNDNNVLKIAKQCSNLIIDNAHAFYSKPIEGVDTFYSPRKFFGISDGAYLYTNKIIEQHLERDKSYCRFEHLLRRTDEDAESGYPYFVKNDESLCKQPILQMSHLTRQLLQSIDYESIADKRKENFEYMYKALNCINKIKWDTNNIDVPMLYPFYSENLNLKKTLSDRQIYTAQYWPNVVKWVKKNTVEYKYSTNLIHLPIDQRLNKFQLDKIIEIITS